MEIIEYLNLKSVRSENYNYIFNKNNGNFIRWGKDIDDDPDFSPYGCEIADIEISTICHGLGTPCTFCYKSNTAVGKNMSFETFKVIFDRLPKITQKVNGVEKSICLVTQVALGIGDLEKKIFLRRKKI